MTEKTHEKELDALKADIASLCETIAALATGVKKLAETKTAEPHAEGEHEAGQQEGLANGGHGHGAGTDVQPTLGGARAQGQKAVKGLADEIERHPLMSSLAALGLGFIIAKRWYGGNKP
jgi:hypothetical protein